MKITATLLDNAGNLTFEPFGYSERLLVGEKYTLEVKPYKSSRSLEQNSLLWKLIHSIAKVSYNDEMDIYISGLEELGVKTELLIALPETEPSLKKGFRAIKQLNPTFIGFQEAFVYKVYIGSSKFNTAEMNQLISFFEGQANDLGIYLEADRQP